MRFVVGALLGVVAGFLIGNHATRTQLRRKAGLRDLNELEHLTRDELYGRAQEGAVGTVEHEQG